MFNFKISFNFYHHFIYSKDPDHLDRVQLGKFINNALDNMTQGFGRHSVKTVH